MSAGIGYSLLIDAGLKSVGVLGCAWLITRWLENRSAARRHLVWTGAFAALLALPTLTLSLPALRSPVFRQILPDEVLFRTNVARATKVEAPERRLTGPGQRQGGPPLPDWRTVIVLFWGCGAIVSLGQTLAAAMTVTRMRRRARKVTAAELAGIREALGMDQAVEVLEANSGTMPMAIGLLRPAVLLPARAMEWTLERLRVVLLHELAHLQRGDIATNMLARLALSLYWWNPLAWKAWRELVKERERAADDLVLATGARASEYAGHLLEIARTLSAPRAVGPTALAMARPSDLEGRVSAILDSGRRRGPAARGSAWMAVVLAVVIVSPLAAIRGQEIKQTSLPADIDAAIRAAQAEHNFNKLDSAGATAVTLRQWAVAQKLLEVSLAIRGQTSGQQSIVYGVGLSNLGDLARRQGHKDAAAWYTQAEGLLGNHPEAASALTYLGIAALGDKKYDQAMDYLQRAETAESSSHAVAQIIEWMAIVRDRQGRIEEADELYRKAIWQGHGYPNGPEPATDQELYASFLQRQHRETELQALRTQIETEQKSLREQRASPLPDGVFQIGGDVAAPKLVSKVEPGYTEEARIARYQGTLVMSVEVGTDGFAHNTKVLRGLGLGLDDRALDAVSQWKFQPATKSGQPVAVAATIEVNFRLL